jgi:membrane fusion protein, multidrug efflux system
MSQAGNKPGEAESYRKAEEDYRMERNGGVASSKCLPARRGFIAMTDYRQLSFAGVLLATLAASLLSLSGCAKTQAAPSRTGPIPVQVVAATQRDVPLFGDWVATTDGYVNAQIQPQVSGYLIRQDYKEGSVVRKGQVLFEIDPRPFQAVLDQAKGSLAQTEAQAELALINVNRDTQLAQAQVISKSQLDNELKQLQTNRAAVESAKAAVEQAELNLGFTKVRSLIDGVAGQATTQVGNLVSPTSVLTAVSQLDPVKVYFSISEQEYLALTARARSRGKHDMLSSGSQLPLKLTLANGETYPHPGHIVFVDRSITAQTGSLRIAASFPNPGNLLRPGQFGRIQAATEVERNAVLVPQRAVNELQGNYQVAVVGPDNLIKFRSVKLGPQVGDKIVIADGLQAGERVVTEGIDKLKDGVPVAAQTAAPTEAAPSRGQ